MDNRRHVDRVYTPLEKIRSGSLYPVFVYDYYLYTIFIIYIIEIGKKIIVDKPVYDLSTLSTIIRGLSTIIRQAVYDYFSLPGGVAHAS